MKFLLCTTLLFLCNLLYSQQINSTYEWDEINKLDFANSFGGAFFSIEDNPKVDSANDSQSVAKFSKAGANISEWAGIYADLEIGLKISSNTMFKLQVYSPSSWGVLKLKLEQRADNKFRGLYDVDQYISLSNAWQEIKFDISSVPTNSVTRIVLTFDFGKTEPTEYYYDNLLIE
jgi:hypothetical protein